MKKEVSINWGKFIFIAIGVVVIGLLFGWLYFLFKESNSKKTRLEQLLDRKQKELSDLVLQLEILEKLKIFIDIRLNRFFVFLKMCFVSFFGGIVFYFTGSLLGAFDIISTLYLTFIFIFFKKMHGVEVYQMEIYSRLESWFYKKYGFDNSVIMNVREVVDKRRNEVDYLKNRIAIRSM